MNFIEFLSFAEEVDMDSQETVKESDRKPVDFTSFGDPGTPPRPEIGEAQWLDGFDWRIRNIDG